MSLLPSPKSLIDQGPQYPQREKLAEQGLVQVIRLAKQACVFESAPLTEISSNEACRLPQVGTWLFLGDAAALFFAFAIGGSVTWLIDAYVFHTHFQSVWSDATVIQFSTFFVLSVVALLWLDTKGHYRERLPFWEIIGNILTVASVGFIVGGFIQFAIKGLNSRLWFGLSWVLFAVLLHFGRAAVRGWLNRRGLWEIPAVIVGDGPTAQSAVRALTSEPQMGYKIVDVVPAETLKDLAQPRDWRRFMESMGARYFFLAVEGGELEQYKNSLKAMARERLPYSILPPWLGLPLSGLSSHHFMMHDVMLMHDTNRLRLPLPRLMKRTFDVVVAGSVLFVLAPLFAFVSFLVRCDGGKAFFRQSRVGINGKKFTFYKFRSMRDDAETALNDYLENNLQASAEWKKFQKLKNDPRITKAGRFIRRTSLDELPQLINVLKGDMSLVGPRPFIPGQEVYYGDDYTFYTSARPGITGPWQVSGRNMLTFQQRVALEAWYVRNWSFWLDIVILMKTVPALLKRDRAF
jgi:Undecaprenyl-phosphate galactose phosphotransferase WbaP